MLRDFFWKIFPPYESGIIKRQILGFLEADNGLAKDEIERLVLSYLKRKPGTVVEAIRINHIPADHVALALVTGILKTGLTSGSNHVYRGMLGMIGEDMYRVWYNAISMMVEKGYLKTEDAERLRNEVRSKIKSEG